MYRIIKEGSVEILIPSESEELKRNVVSSSETVFYNPEMELNRDINVLMTSIATDYLVSEKGFDKNTIEYIDAFSATGIRGLRVAKDVGISVILNDWKPEAYELIQKNIVHNQNQSQNSQIGQNGQIGQSLSLNATALKCDANVLLNSRYAAFVDIDPFGSPAAFLASASKSASFFLGITATDTAPLCGAHLKSGIRKYSAVPVNNECHGETGVRILLGSIAREMAKIDKGMKVVLAHATRHYVRCYLQVLRGVENADKTLSELGFWLSCPKCGFHKTYPGLLPFVKEECPNCSNVSVKLSGPLWLGPLKDVHFCKKAVSKIPDFNLNRSKDVEKLLNKCIEELDIPFFYDQHKLCKEFGVSAIPMQSFLEKIKAEGYSASLTHFSGTSFKTDAPLNVIKKIVADSNNK
ncbi:MAG: tRNA (guanine(10)-N(2))-dimethyltransferase [Methanosarcinaceae archaeon]|nr:tRNA (guanine(10)-N(2))-dimethyltransferase [Methanosarcinaceae archaeon]